MTEASNCQRRNGGELFTDRPALSWRNRKAVIKHRWNTAPEKGKVESELRVDMHIVIINMFYLELWIDLTKWRS